MEVGGGEARNAACWLAGVVYSSGLWQASPSSRRRVDGGQWLQLKQLIS